MIDFYLYLQYFSIYMYDLNLLNSKWLWTVFEVILIATSFLTCPPSYPSSLLSGGAVYLQQDTGRWDGAGVGGLQHNQKWTKTHHRHPGVFWTWGKDDINEFVFLSGMLWVVVVYLNMALSRSKHCPHSQTGHRMLFSYPVHFLGRCWTRRINLNKASKKKKLTTEPETSTRCRTCILHSELEKNSLE